MRFLADENISKLIVERLRSCGHDVNSIAESSSGAPDREVLHIADGEDSTAEADTNFVMTGQGGIVEVQGTAEGEPFTLYSFDELMGLAKNGIRVLTDLQILAVG